MNVIFLVWVSEKYNINTCFQEKDQFRRWNSYFVLQNNFTRFSHVPDYQEWERKMFSCLWSCLVPTISVMMYGFALETWRNVLPLLQCPSLSDCCALDWNSWTLYFKTSFMTTLNLLTLWSKFPLFTTLMDQLNILNIHEDEYKEVTAPLLLTWLTYK